jgi:putative ABC transport system substrate-binding protein
MRRREFLTLLGAVAGWPLAARAQQPHATIGLLSLGSPEGSEVLRAFRKGLNEAGYVEGRNVTIEFRWAENDPKRLPELAADLVARRVDVIVVSAGTPAVQAAKAATATIPIVFRTGADPVRSGLVASLNRPAGNVTGVSALAQEAERKRLGLLNEMRPGAGPIAVLHNPNDDDFDGRTTEAELQAAAAILKRPLEFFYADSSREIDAAFEEMTRKKAEAVLVNSSNLFTNRAGQITILAARHALPAINVQPEFARLGGLMSYGSSVADQLRQVGIYAGRILKGEKPSDLPVMQATKFELVINLQTARTLGIEVPPTLIATADEIIE